MAAASIIWFIVVIITSSSSEVLKQYTAIDPPNNGICKSTTCNSIACFRAAYKDCRVVIGNLILSLMEKTTPEHFKNVSFPDLREVTGFFVAYRVSGLLSLGMLFPNLTRIRGEQLLNNYGLIVHDMPSLKEIGLYGLIKLDRGGVIVWGVPEACFVETIDWKEIAPRSRHVINMSFQERLTQCKFSCTCSDNATFNHCWNNKKCQLYIKGPEADNCDPQCLGCRKTKANECSVCKHYTYNGTCVPKCPENTIVLPDCQYCITEENCRNLSGWVFNNSCVFHCPISYIEINTTKGPTCKFCADCDTNCTSQKIQTMRAIQAAESCVYINGSLEIHLRLVSEAMDELRTYLSRIEEVSDYILIYGSITITSLDFLPSLKRIGGRNLRNGKYSLVIYDMISLQKLFSSNVTKNLKIERGTLKMYSNPILCTKEIDKIKPLFPVQPNDLDLPQGMNGYSGSCDDVSVKFQIKIINENSVAIRFLSLPDPDAHYSVLYVRLPPGKHETLVPETCSEAEWYVVNVNIDFGHQDVVVELTSLRPASTYAICIETYDPIHRKLGRSAIEKFATPVGIPEPPFIRELSASKSGPAVIRWVDHKDFRPHIKHYELDVSLIEIFEKDITVKNQCEHMETIEEDLTQHAVVMTPPEEYTRGCESMCGVLSSLTAGALIEDYFDICSGINCNDKEDIIATNTSLGKYIRTLVLNLTSPRSAFRIGSLAPFRDYRFRLRACTDTECSRSARSVVRTLPLGSADIPSIKYAHANEYGHIAIEWDPPEITNGPILSYVIEVLPTPKTYDYNSHQIPQSMCVLANETRHNIITTPANKYNVRVCTRSMASNKACCTFRLVEAVSELPESIMMNRWWLGLICGIVLYSTSIVIGYRIKRRVSEESIDLVPIIDPESSHRNESEPPSQMFSDFAPMYSIPLRDSRLE